MRAGGLTSTTTLAWAAQTGARRRHRLQRTRRTKLRRPWAPRKIPSTGGPRAGPRPQRRLQHVHRPSQSGACSAAVGSRRSSGEGGRTVHLLAPVAGLEQAEVRAGEEQRAADEREPVGRAHDRLRLVRRQLDRQPDAEACRGGKGSRQRRDKARGGDAKGMTIGGSGRTVGDPDQAAELEKEGDPERDVGPEVRLEGARTRAIGRGRVGETQAERLLVRAREEGVVVWPERVAGCAPGGQEAGTGASVLLRHEPVGSASRRTLARVARIEHGLAPGGLAAIAVDGRRLELELVPGRPEAASAAPHGRGLARMEGRVPARGGGGRRRRRACHPAGQGRGCW